MTYKAKQSFLKHNKTHGKTAITVLTRGFCFSQSSSTFLFLPVKILRYRKKFSQPSHKRLQPFKQHLYYSTCAIEKQIIHTENNSILCRISTTFVEFCQRALIFNFYRPYIPKRQLRNNALSNRYY